MFLKLQTIFLTLLAMSTPAFAAINTIVDGSNGLPGASIKAGTEERGIITFFTKVVTIIQDITAIAAVLGVCIVGIMLITSQGSEEKTETAKKYMFAIIIGVVIAFTAWALITLIDLIPNAIQF